MTKLSLRERKSARERGRGRGGERKGERDRERQASWTCGAADPEGAGRGQAEMEQVRLEAVGGLKGFEGFNRIGNGRKEQREKKS